VTEGLPGLDLDRLRTYLDEVRPGLVQGALRAQLIAGGRSNLTYAVSDAEHDWVVRRPPLGHVLATAHDMVREHRVIAAMHEAGIPTPGTVVLCEDVEVLGSPFFVMTRSPGAVVRTREHADTLGPDVVARTSYDLVDLLARIHALDPDAIGLGTFGRPDGYLERQVRRWGQQLDSSRSRALPGIDELGRRLALSVPAPQRASVVHGDYRLENVLVEGDGSISAVLDWEMSTLGDPLADVGLLHVYWDAVPRIGPNPIVDAVHPELGFPDMSLLLEQYAVRSGLDLTDLPWYVAFGAFKLAIVLEGIHYRHGLGQTVGEGFDRIGELVAPLIDYGTSAAEGI
jgi:aminoglycoside phosphotransferase (APT) family kinase protein